MCLGKNIAREGNSLFGFRLVLGLAGAILTLPLVICIIALVVRMVMRGGPDVAGIMTAVGFFLCLLIAAIVFALINKFTMDFVVPIQYLRGAKCLAAWREYLGLLKRHAGQFILYILFQIVLSMAIGILVLAALLVTCCFCCLALLPYIGTVLLLPVLVFQRAYSLSFFAQFGPSYDVFPPVPPPRRRQGCSGQSLHNCIVWQQKCLVPILVMTMEWKKRRG